MKPSAHWVVILLATRMIVASIVLAQSMPEECIQVVKLAPSVGVGERIDADPEERAAIDSILQAGDPSATPPDPLIKLYRSDSVGVLAGLAMATADPSRLGTRPAYLASQYYRQLSGAPGPMLLALRLSHDASRRAMGLQSITVLHSKEEKE